MANWKKVIVSGSNVELNDISASGNVVPQNTDGGSLGTTSLNWSDLFLDSGAVINFDNGDATITHAAGKLTFGGDGAVELDFNNHEMTNVDIDSGAIDGTIIGGASAAAGSFTTVVASGNITANGNIAGDNSTNISGIADITTLGNSSFGNAASDTHTITGAVTASAAISASDFIGGSTLGTQLTGSFSGSFTGTFDGADNLVDVSGTPSDNQIAIFTDANTIEGDADITFDGTDMLLGGNAGTTKLQFRDSTEYINSSTNGQLDIVAGSEVQIATTTVDINAAVDISGNTTIGGDLIVNGDTTTVSTTNVTVGDPFIFLATGSAATNVDAGIVVQSGSAVDSGSAFYHDKNDERWAVAKGIKAADTAVTALQYVTTVRTSTSTPGVSTAGEFGIGEMWIDTNEDDGAGNGTIYILTEE